jgi:hypothetical protein
MAGLFKQKTEDERAAESARRAEAAFWASPQGKATQAFDRGDEFWHPANTSSSPAK